MTNGGDALVIGLAKKVKPRGEAKGDEAEADKETDDNTDEGDDKEMSLDEVEDSAASDLADALGIKGADVGAAKAALRDFVEACLKRRDAGEY